MQLIDSIIVSDSTKMKLRQGRPLLLLLFVGVTVYYLFVHEATYRGTNGQHKFYQAKARDWYIEPEIIQRMCRETNFTQCEPPARRTDLQKQTDRSIHAPFQVSVYRPFPWEPLSPQFSECDFNNCVYGGRGVTPQTDAVFVYGFGLTEHDPQPEVRLPHQVFVFGNWEPPAYTSVSDFAAPSPKWHKFFNATMTYRVDSDIRYSYGKLDFQPKQQKDLPDYRALARKKTRTAVWIVSKCEHIQSKRLQYVREMQKYITVDIWGACGMGCKVNDERCVPDLGTTYSFYLSFENSYSKGYVTEKFFKLFIDDMHIIPVVRGALDYNREFPQKAFVDAADFKGPKQLALFLKSLEEDKVEYSKYLEVKDRYRSVPFGNRWCYVCEYLHKLHKLPEAKRHKVVDVMKELYHGQVLNPPPIPVEFNSANTWTPDVIAILIIIVIICLIIVATISLRRSKSSGGLNASFRYSA